MNKTTIFLLVLVVAIVAVAGLFFFYSPQKRTLSNPKIDLTVKETKPSETFIDYKDPSGFSFSYPDNLSISNTASETSADVADPNAYADLQLFSNDVSGSLNLKIADTKFKTLDEWLKANNIPASNTPIEKKLGNLKALEVKTTDRLMLASLDQGVLFTVELPLIEEDFWMKVYERLLTDFTFAPPAEVAQEAPNFSGEEVIFEGEEVVE